MTDILDQNNPNHATGEISGAYGTFGGGNSFTTGEGVTNISKLTHWCWTNAGGAGDTYVQIYLDSDLSLVGNSDVKDASTLSTSAEDNSWVWSTPLTLLPNTVYRWILRYPNGGEGNSIHIYGQTPDCYAGGIYWQEDSGTWTPLANYDTDFKTYYSEGVLKELSDALNFTATFSRLWTLSRIYAENIDIADLDFRFLYNKYCNEDIDLFESVRAVPTMLKLYETINLLSSELNNRIFSENIVVDDIATLKGLNRLLYQYLKLEFNTYYPIGFPELVEVPWTRENSNPQFREITLNKELHQHSDISNIFNIYDYYYTGDINNSHTDYTIKTSAKIKVSDSVYPTGFALIRFYGTATIVGEFLGTANFMFYQDRICVRSGYDNEYLTDISIVDIDMTIERKVDITISYLNGMYIKLYVDDVPKLEKWMLPQSGDQQGGFLNLREKVLFGLFDKSEAYWSYFKYVPINTGDSALYRVYGQDKEINKTYKTINNILDLIDSKLLTPLKILSNTLVLDDIYNIMPVKSLSDTLTIGGIINFLTNKVLTNNLDILDSLIKNISTYKNEILDLNDIYTIAKAYLLQEILGLNDTFAYYIYKYLIQTEVLNIDDVLVKKPLKEFTEIIDLIDARSVILNRTFFQTLDLTDYFFGLPSYYKILTETLNFLGIVSYSAEQIKAMIETPNIIPKLIVSEFNKPYFIGANGLA